MRTIKIILVSGGLFVLAWIFHSVNRQTASLEAGNKMEPHPIASFQWSETERIRTYFTRSGYPPNIIAEVLAGRIVGRESGSEVVFGVNTQTCNFIHLPEIRHEPPPVSSGGPQPYWIESNMPEFIDGKLQQAKLLIK